MNARMTPEQALVALSTMSEGDFPTAEDAEIRNADGHPLTDADVDRFVDTARRATGRPSLTGPGRHSPQLTLRLPEPVNDQLEQLSARTGKRRSEIVREALNEYLKSA